MLLTYSQDRDVKGNEYFKQYKDWGNMAMLWKTFGSVKFELENDMIRSVNFRILDFTTIGDLQTLLMLVPRYFPNFTCEYIKGIKNQKWEIRPCIPTVKVTPKEETVFIEIPEWLTDKITTKPITEKQLAQMSSSPWFIT